MNSEEMLLFVKLAERGEHYPYRDFKSILLQEVTATTNKDFVCNLLYVSSGCHFAHQASLQALTPLQTI